MKVSQLKQIVAQMVREELERQVPLIMSEMFVRTIVQECVSTAAPLAGVPSQPRRPEAARPSRPAPARSALREALELDDAAGSEFYGESDPAPLTRVNPHPAAAPARSALGNLNPMLAALAEDTVESIERGEHEEASLPLPGNLDFSRMRSMITESEQRSNRPRPSVDVEQARLDMVRKRLENIKVG